MSSSFSDDLYITNPIYPPSSARGNQQDDTKVYQRLLHAKNTATTTYPRNVPDFAVARPPSQKFQTGVPEDSPGFDQYMNMSMNDKWKKVKKTLINIDSRNRRMVTYYDKIDMTLRRYTEFRKPEFNFPFLFEGNSNVVYLLLETQYTNEIENKQFAILSAPTNLFTEIGSDDTNFIFDTFVSKPVFNVDKFIYDPLVDANIDDIGNRDSNINSEYLDSHIVSMPEVYNIDVNVKQYKYNVIRFRIESNIDKSLIKRGIIGDSSVRISFISSVRQAYPNSSHYIMNLGKTFGNIYSVRLVSTEIPNTAYTFNNNIYTSEFGQMKLKTEVNNRLSWIYKSDEATQLNYHIMSSSLYRNYTDKIAVYQDYSTDNETHYNYIRNSFELINTDNPQFELNTNILKAIQRRFSIYQQNNAYMTDDNDFTIKKNNYFDTRYLLELTKASTTNINSQGGFNLPNTLFTTQELLYSYIKDLYRTHTFYHGRFLRVDQLSSVFSSGKIVNNSAVPVDNKTMFIFDPLNLRLIVSIYLDRNDRYYTDFVKDNILDIVDPDNTSITLESNNYPLRIDLRSMQNKDLTKMTSYTFDIVSVELDNDYIYDTTVDTTISTSAYRRNYFLYFVPQGGKYDTSANMMFNDNERIVMTQWNDIKPEIIKTIQSNNPYLYSILKKYYLKTYVQNQPVYTRRTNDGQIEDIWKYYDSIYKPLTIGNDDLLKTNILTEIIFQFTTSTSIKNCQFTTFSSTNLYPNPGKFSIDTSNNLIYINSADVPSNFLEDILPYNYYLVIFPVYFFIDVKKTRRFRTSTNDTIILSYYNSCYGINPYTNFNYMVYPAYYLYTSSIIPVSFTNGNSYIFEFQSPRWENMKGFYFKYPPVSTSGSELNNFMKDQLFGDLRDQIGVIRFTSSNQGTTYQNSNLTNFNFLDLYVINYELRTRSNNSLVYRSSDTDISSTFFDYYNYINYYVYFNARIKSNTNFLENQEHEFTGNVPSNLDAFVHVFKEVHRTFLRNSIHSYLSLKTENIDTNSQNVILTNVYNAFIYDSRQQTYVYDLSVNTIPYIYDLAQSNNLRHTEFCDLLDFSQYNVVGITKTTYDKGLTSTQFAKEYIEEVPKSTIVVYPAVDENSPRLLLPFEISENSENASIDDLKVYRRFPVYQLDIVPSKYTENTLTQYFLKNMGNIRRKYYNYQQEIFTSDSVYQNQSNVLYETNTQSECKTVVSIQRATNSIQFKQYRKIFESYKNQTERVSTNQGFPFIYFHVPETSVSNGSLIYIEGLQSVANLSASSLNAEHMAYIPRNYRVKVRQLLPLPDISVLQNAQTMFGEVGYVKNGINELYNKTINFINNSIEENNIRDPYIEFILQQVIGINESGYNHHTQDPIHTYKQSGYVYEKDTFIPPNSESMIYNTDTRSSYMTPYGRSSSYTSIYGYGNQKVSQQTRNRYGLEYISSAWVNAARNGTLWNEYRNGLNLSTKEVRELFKSSFIQGECFMKLSTIHQADKYMNIARIRHLDPYPDMNGNVEFQYDLFTENNTQFSMFDIVIGLDSQSIGIIVPYDYEYAQLPSIDMILLGLGTYLLHRYSSQANHVAEIINSIDHLLNPLDTLKRKFIRSANKWTIEENSTPAGFYIKSDIIPNTSIHIPSPNLRIYVPEFFRFIDTEDSPMKLFGFENTIYNNQFNYFKDNFTPYQSALINRSYISYFQNKETFIIFEAKEINEYEINDTIFIEEHRIIQPDLNKYKDRFMRIARMEPMAHYLTRMETIYNTQVLNHSGLAYPLLFGDSSHELNMFINDVVSYQKYPNINSTTNYFHDTVYALTSTKSVHIPFKNRFIAHHFHEEYDCVSSNYNLYYKVAPESLLIADSSATTTQVFDISYNVSKGLSIFIGGTDILQKFKTQKVAYHCNFIPTNSFEDRYKRQQETITFYKTERSTQFVSKDNFEIVPLSKRKQYTIRVHLYRNPVCISTYDVSSNGTLIVAKYDTLGIMERYMHHMMTHFVNYYVNDIARAYYFDTKYNPHLFRNRILKFKVCPVDTLGFSYEPANANGSIYTTSTNMSQRVCKGRSRKLFPYVEYQIANTYNRLEDGEAVVPNSYVYRTYQRPFTPKDNNQSSSKLFMPGMGVYAITESITSQKTGNLPATAYEYNSSFIGYILNTSVQYDQTDYARNYTLNSREFAERDLSSSVYSEYEAYILMDPQIQTRQQVSQLFDLLNKDYTHIVYDADAAVDEVLSIDGILSNSRRPYSYEYTMDLSGIVTLGNLTNPTIENSEYAYPIPQNRLNQCTLWTNSQFYYTENDDWDISNDRIPVANVDSLLGLTASNVVIHRPILNNTLPSYSFQKRIACATLTQRPVMLTEEGVDASAASCLFITGEYDLFYKEYVESKTVVHYEPVRTRETMEYINRHQLLTDNARTNSFHSKNVKEFDSYAGHIDDSIQQSYEFADAITYKESDREPWREVQERITFDVGDDVIFVRNRRGDKGVASTETVKVLSSAFMSSIYADETRFIHSSWNDQLRNTCILDIDYFNYDMESLHKSPCLMKKKGYDIDIIGNQFSKFTQDVDTDKYDYNLCLAYTYNETDGYSGSTLTIASHTEYNTTGSSDIHDLYKVNDFEHGWRQYQLKGSLFITFPVLETYTGAYPYNSVDFSELAVVDLVNYTPSSPYLTVLLENRLYENYNIVNQQSSIESAVSIPYKTYKTVNTANIDRLYTRDTSNNRSNTSVSHLLSHPDRNVILIEMASNMKFSTSDTVENKNNYKKYNDVYIDDLTLQDNTMVAVDYGNQRRVEYKNDGSTPYKIDYDGTLISQVRQTTNFTQISRSNNSQYHRVMADMFVDSYVDVSNSTDISSNSGDIVIRHGYGIYRNSGSGFHRYVDAEGVGRNYAISDISSVKRHYKCYGEYLNEVDIGETGHILPRYKYACISHPNYSAVDIVFDAAMLPTIVPDMSGRFVLVRSNTTGLYRCLGGNWVQQTISNYTGAVFEVDASSSFYYKDIYVMDGELNRYIALYEAELYRDTVFQSYFLYDKLDVLFTIPSTRTIVPSDGQYFKQHMKIMVRTYTTDYLDRPIIPHTAKFYYVRGSSSDPSNNFLEEYSVPENATIKVQYETSGNLLPQTNYIKIPQTFLYTTNRIIRLSPTSFNRFKPQYDIQDILYDTSVDISGVEYSSIPPFMPTLTYKFLSTNTQYTTDVDIFDTVNYVPVNTDARIQYMYVYQKFNDSYRLTLNDLRYEMPIPAQKEELEYTFKVNSHLYARYGIEYVYSMIDFRYTIFPVYPVNADIAVFDILTEDQVAALTVEVNKYPSLLENNQIIITTECNVYRYNSSTRQFDEYNSSLLLGKSVYIYGTFAGNKGKLVRRIANTTPLMTTAEYSADYNVADLIRITNDASYYSQIVSAVNAGQYSRYDFILVHRPDSINDTERYSVYRIDGSGIPQQLQESTLFPIYNRTYFVSNPMSPFRGLTYKLHSGAEMHQVVVALTDQKLPIYYPENTRVISMTNPLRDRSSAKDIYSNQLSTQPFLSGNQWYTKIFYRGSTALTAEITDKFGNTRRIFNGLTNENYKQGGEERFGAFESQKLFFSGMKGFRLPLITVQPPSSSSDPYYYGKVSQYSTPMYPDYYTTENPLAEDYSPYLAADRNVRDIFGVFQRGNDWDYTDKKYKYHETESAVQYPYVIVPGFYMGYGGRIQERQDEDFVNSMVNNDNGLKVSRISSIGGKQYIYAELPIQQNYLFEESEKYQRVDTKIADKTRNRIADLPYDVQFNYIDKLFQNTDYLNSLISLFGVDGRIVKKRINNPYELNQNNYIFLVIPNLNHIDNIQNTSFSSTDGAFAKVLLPGDSNRVVYNTYVAGTKVYYDKLFTNLSELEVAFVTNKGTLFDFNGAEHSFTLEITEIIDKLEYINTRAGSIEN
jgi:hypothetical protein